VGALTGRDYGVAVVIVAICAALVYLGYGVALPSLMTWFPQAEKPLSLPATQTLLFMRAVALVAGGVALWLVWRACVTAEPPRSVVLPAALWLATLAMEGTWHIAFHVLRRFELALAVAGVEFVLAIVLWRVFRRYNKIAGFLMLLILIWVFYTLREAHRFWQLNPAL